MYSYNDLPKTRNGLREKAMEISKDNDNSAVIIIVKPLAQPVRVANYGLEAKEVRLALLEAIEFTYKYY